LNPNSPVETQKPLQQGVSKRSNVNKQKKFDKLEIGLTKFYLHYFGQKQLFYAPSWGLLFLQITSKANW
jgi:hypothetical protein